MASRRTNLTNLNRKRDRGPDSAYSKRGGIAGKGVGEPLTTIVHTVVMTLEPRCMLKLRGWTGGVAASTLGFIILRRTETWGFG